MSSIRENNRVAALLREMRGDEGLSLERLALLCGVPVDNLRACREHELALSPAVQIRVARAVAAGVPRLARNARRLEGQANAAAMFEAGANAVHLTPPTRWR